ncbi:MAG: histidinol-phosphate transaminase [Spirochaetia bacterium]|nr:histidinol-phosphate transaminase [Spirochaetia bacterium]
MQKKSYDFSNQYVKNLKPYVPGEQPQEEGYIKLNTNENPYAPSENVFNEIKKLIQKPELFKKYPNSLSEPLRSTIAKKYKLKPENVLITNGSDEALSIICRAFIDSGNFIVYPEVTYSLYETLISAVGGNIVSVPMIQNNDVPLQINLDKIKETYGKIVFLPNPNAPTGEYIHNSKLAAAIKNNDKLWIIDEAYNDFVEEKNPSFLDFIHDFENVIITRTFSKSHSLAGLRIGFAVSVNDDLMKSMYAMKDSYNEDVLAITAAKAAFEDEKYLKEQIKKIQAQKNVIINKLKNLDFTVLPSQANFILAKPPQSIRASELYQKLKEKKILIRYFAESKISEYIRISVGSEQENIKLIGAINNTIKN